MDRGDIDAGYTWLPTLDELRKNGKDLITSRQLADDGKPTLDLAVVSDEFAAAHPEVVDTWRNGEARALDAHQGRPGRGRQGDRRRDRPHPGGRRGPAEAGRAS